jgi:hypothetical protein
MVEQKKLKHLSLKAFSSIVFVKVEHLTVAYTRNNLGLTIKYDTRLKMLPRDEHCDVFVHSMISATKNKSFSPAFDKSQTFVRS